MAGGDGASGILGGGGMQAAIDKFTRGVDQLIDAIGSIADGASSSGPAPTMPQSDGGGATFTKTGALPNAGGASFTSTRGGGTSGGGANGGGASFAGSAAASLGGGGSGMLGSLARGAMSFAPAPVAALVGGLASAGAAQTPSQMALNTLQYQSAIYGQSYQTTRMGAMGTAGNVNGGQLQVEWGLNPSDMAATYASLQQTTAQLNPYATGPGSLGAANVMGTMGGMNIANPGMSGVQNAQAVSQFYNPQTSMNMAMMGFGNTPDQMGTGAHNSFADTMSPLLGRLASGNGGKPMTQQQLMAQLAPGQKGNVDLANLTGGNPQEMNQYTSLLEMQNALMTGANKQPKMSLGQVNSLFSQLASSDVDTFNAAEATLEQYGISQSAIQMQKSKAGNQAETTSDQSQAFMDGLQGSTRAISDFNTALNKVINSVPGGRGAVGWLESTTANILGGGSATMYDSTVPDEVPTTLLSGTSSLMIAYYVSNFSAPTKSKFPASTQFVTIDQAGTRTDADVVDMESGAVFPASAVNAWLKKAGGNKVVYATPSNKAALDATKPPAYSWWAAEWNGSQTVPAGAVAHQFASASTYDTSIVSDPGAFNGQGGGGASPAASPAAGASTTKTTTTSGGNGGIGGIGAGLGDYSTEGSTEELAAFSGAIIGGSLGGGGGTTTTTTTTAAAPAGTTPAAAPAAGGKTMYDTQYPSIVPSSADLVVSYVDGPAGNSYQSAQSKFGSRALSITWTGENADIADVESSAVSTSQLPAWIDAQIARGIPKPVVYAIYSGIGTNYQQVKQAVGTKSVSFWLSDWTGKPHSIPGADAVQYGAQASPSSPMITDPGKAGGQTYDLSSVASSFPYYGGAPTLKPPKGNSQQEVPQFTSETWAYSGAHPAYSGGHYSGITINFPAGSIVADDPTTAATQAVQQLKTELVRLNLVSN